MVEALFFFVLGWMLAVGIVIDLLWSEYHPKAHGPQIVRSMGSDLQTFAAPFDGVANLGLHHNTRRTVGDTLPTDLLDYFEIVEVDGRPKVRWAW